MRNFKFAFFTAFLSMVSASRPETKPPVVVIYETEKSQIHPSANNFIFQQIHEPWTREVLDVRVAGTGEKWEGWGSKAKHVAQELQSVEPDRLVIVSDSRDVLLNNFDSDSLEKLVEDFKSLTTNKEHAIVVGAESQCCVSALTHAQPGDFLNDDLSRTGKKETCNSGKGDCLHKGNIFEQPWKDAMHKIANDQGAKTSKNVYLNTGIIIGKAKDILNAYAILNMKEAEDDQALFTELLLKRPELIALDYEQKLIGNNAWSEGMDGCIFDWDAEMQKFKHPEFETFPAFLHFQGKFYECYGKLARKLGYIGNMRRKLADAPHGNNYDTTPKPPSPAIRSSPTSSILSLAALMFAGHLFH